MLKITTPAIRQDGETFVGPNHRAIAADMIMFCGKKTVDGEYGFLDSNGEFRDRETAGLIAFAAGQTQELEKTLQSEHIKRTK